MSFRLSFYVPGKPVGKGRARSAPLMRGGAAVIGRGGRPIVIHHTPEKTVNFENLIAYHGQQAMNGQALCAGPLHLNLLIDIDVPASWSQKKRQKALDGALLPTKKPDCSNIIKAIEDALNQVVYVDDVQIVRGAWEKRYREQAGVTVLLQSIDEAEGG
jgi:Holliday junction resolvase RusA-like endonuclease